MWQNLNEVVEELLQSKFHVSFPFDSLINSISDDLKQSTSPSHSLLCSSLFPGSARTTTLSVAIPAVELLVYEHCGLTETLPLQFSSKIVHKLLIQFFTVWLRLGYSL